MALFRNCMTFLPAFSLCLCASSSDNFVQSVSQLPKQLRRLSRNSTQPSQLLERPSTLPLQAPEPKCSAKPIKMCSTSCNTNPLSQSRRRPGRNVKVSLLSNSPYQPVHRTNKNEISLLNSPKSSRNAKKALPFPMILSRRSRPSYHSSSP